MSGATRQLWDHVQRTEHRCSYLRRRSPLDSAYQRLEQVAGRVVGRPCRLANDVRIARLRELRPVEAHGLGEDHLLVRKRCIRGRKSENIEAGNRNCSSAYGRRPTETSKARQSRLGPGARSHRRTHRRKSGISRQQLIRIPRRTAEGSVRSCVAQGLTAIQIIGICVYAEDVWGQCRWKQSVHGSGVFAGSLYRMPR